MYNCNICISIIFCKITITLARDQILHEGNTLLKNQRFTVVNGDFFIFLASSTLTCDSVGFKCERPSEPI